jgi:hypothetical protein
VLQGGVAASSGIARSCVTVGDVKLSEVSTLIDNDRAKERIKG